MYYLAKIFCVLIGYFFGCILTAEIVARANNKDVKTLDPSCPNRGNPGMANIMINLGFKQGVLVFIGDSLKTIMAMLLCYFIFKDFKQAYMFAGFGVMLGHNYPFWRNFNGGKGVLVTIMWFIAIMPIHCWIGFVIAGIVVLITGYLNLAAIIFPIVSIPFAYYVLGKEIATLVVVSAIIMVIRNRRDLMDIIYGRYDRVFLFRKKDKK